MKLSRAFIKRLFHFVGICIRAMFSKVWDTYHNIIVIIQVVVKNVSINSGQMWRGKIAVIQYLWKQRAIWQWFPIERRYHLDKQFYFRDIYPREIKILIRIYMFRIVSCSTQFFLKKGRERTKEMLSKGQW